MLSKLTLVVSSKDSFEILKFTSTSLYSVNNVSSLVALMKRLNFCLGSLLLKKFLDVSWFRMHIGLSTWMFKLVVILWISLDCVAITSPTVEKNLRIFEKFEVHC